MPMTLEEKIGDRVRRLREAADLRQQDLATAAGVAISIITQIEQGRTTDPRLSTLAAIAKGLGMDLRDLVAGLRISGLRRKRRPRKQE
jgi:transcriptional regulator with XRE-family HTH domain